MAKSQKNQVHSGSASGRQPALMSLSAFASHCNRSLSLIVREARHRSLQPAMVGDRLNAAHPAATAWLEARGLELPPWVRLFLRREQEAVPKARAARPASTPPPAPMPPEVSNDGLVRVVSVAELAERFGESPEELLDRLSSALVPDHLVDGRELARIAEVPLAHVRDALLGELGAARTQSGLIDLTHPATLAWLRAHPLGEHLPPGILAPAEIDEDHIDLDHPLTRAILARAGVDPDDLEGLRGVEAKL